MNCCKPHAVNRTRVFRCKPPHNEVQQPVQREPRPQSARRATAQTSAPREPAPASAQPPAPAPDGDDGPDEGGGEEWEDEQDTRKVHELLTEANTDSKKADDLYARLADLPTPKTFLPGHVMRALVEKASELARDYLAKPDRASLLAFLLLPKVAITQDWSESVQRIKKFPDVMWPTRSPPRLGPRPPRPLREKIHALLQQGRIERASDELDGAEPIAEHTPDLAAKVQRLYPNGARYPGPQRRTREAYMSVPSDLDAAKSFKYRIGKSSGLSGWPIGALRQALRDEDVAHALVRMAQKLGKGELVGGHVFRQARVTALKKSDGKIRPIVSTDIIERFATRMIMSSAKQQIQGALLPTQAGVGSKGGVEPILYTLQRWVELPADQQRFQYLTTLDLHNAFGSISRSAIFDALRIHAPGFIPLARDKIGGPTTLILGEGEQQSKISVTQGVLQGIPPRRSCSAWASDRCWRSCRRS